MVNRNKGRCAFPIVVTATILVICMVFLGQVAAAGNLPGWGGQTTADQPQVQEPTRTLSADPAPVAVPTVQPTKPPIWRSPGTSITPAPTTSPTVSPTTVTPVRQLQPRAVERAPAEAQWAQWSELAWEATRDAVNNRWKLQAAFRNVVINATTAIGSPGCLAGPDLAPLIRSYMTARGAPSEVADIFANSIGGAWKAWQDGVTIPGLPWYPAFAAWAGPQAPPTPNVPTPLIALVSAGRSELTSSDRLEARILEQFQGGQVPLEARAEIQGFSQRAAGRFLAWISGNQAVGVMGQGPVPTYAPPVVLTGAVVGGIVIPVPGVIQGALLH